MDTNILCIEPNMAMLLENHELKFFNLIWGGWQTSGDPDTSYFTNFLLRRGTDGSVIPPGWPTTVEMQAQVQSLDYTGVNFWSVQAINDTPYYPGWVIRRWQTSESSYGLEMLQFKCFPGQYTAKALAVEHYRFTTLGGTDSSRDWVTFSTDYGYILERLLPGQQIRIGPNAHEQYFLGTIRELREFATHWEVYFTQNFNASYVGGEDAFTEARIYVFDEGGTLYILDPRTLSTISSIQSDLYKGVRSAAFSLIKNVPSINLGNRTRTLFFVRGMAIFCKRVEDLSLSIAVKCIPLNYYEGANSFIPVHELRVRNDDPESVSNHPQFYLLQQDYREGHDSSVGTFDNDTYNYVTLQVEKDAAFMNVVVQPEFVVSSGIVECTATVLDDYRFPVSGADVFWSVTDGSGEFITVTGTVTNSSGIAYATLGTDDSLPFPAYITARTTAM
jgi:hypothetical protein